MADDHPSHDDELLLAELATVLDRVYGPPPAVVEASKALFALRNLDAELAALAHDSVEDQPVEAGVRAGGQPRILTFEADGLTVEVEVDESPGARRMIGQLTPPGPAELELRTPGDPVLGTADDLGRFVLALPAQHRRCSLRVRRGAQVTETAWVTL